MAKAQPKKPVALTPKQLRFVEEYLVDLNATQAAIRAGYSAKTANKQGPALLVNLGIASAIAEARSRLSAKLEITQERVLKEFARLAFLDIRKAFDKDNNLLPIQDMDDDTAAAIAGFEAEAIYEGSGKDRMEVGRLRKVKLSDKKGALDSLAKHLGMFVDRGELNVNVQKAYVGFDPDDV